MPTPLASPAPASEAYEISLSARGQAAPALQGSCGARDVELADSLRPVVLKLGRRLRQEGLKAGLSPLDAQLLAVIKAKPGLGVCELADLEQMSRPAMSVHIKRLEAAGWLVRLAEAGGDRRRTRLGLSAKGLAALTAIRRSRNDWLAARLGRLTAADRAALEACLEPLVRLAQMKT